MIAKIDIERFGLFSNYYWKQHIGTENNQIFNKMNIIYGRNYSGKTTLSRIFRCIEMKQLPNNYHNGIFTITTDNSTITNMNLVCSDKVRVYNTDFVKENHRYRIDWDDSVIFPQLGAEDKVRVKTLYAKRGKIKDAQGNALAVQGKIYSVGFVPGKMDGNSVKLAAKKLGLSKEEIQKKLDQKWVTDDSFVPLIKLKEYSEDLPILRYSSLGYVW